MSLFTKAENTSSFLKMGLLGFAGSGKTMTATLTAIGLVHHMRERKVNYADRPLFFLDTETGSDWVAPKIKAAGIELFTAKTRAFSDLVTSVREAEGTASLLLIDSVTHFWVELCDTYMKKKNRTRLQFEDWAFLKTEWRKFTDLFINSNLHIVLAGRAGFEYDYEVDEETSKKNLVKTGVKMRAEGEMGYEPSLLVLMERHQEMDGNHVKRTWRTATVLKDRSALLDGQEFTDPNFESFRLHIECLNLGGRQMGVDVTRTSAHTIPADVRDNRATQRKIVLAEIEELLVTHYPSSNAADKKTKIEKVRRHFEASWVETETVMPLERLRAGYDTLHLELEGKPSRYHQQSQPAPETNDELPGDLGRPRTAAEAVATVVETRATPALDTTDHDGVPGFLHRDGAAKANGSAGAFSQTEWLLAMDAG